MGVFLLLAADCGVNGVLTEPPDRPDPLALPEAAVVGDEIVLHLSARADGDWAAGSNRGALLEARLGGNRVRHVVLPGDLYVEQRISLGAWDGGPFTLTTVEGHYGGADTWFALAVDPSAADTPVIGTYDAHWDNDTPLLTYVEGGAWTWVFTDEDGGTGLLPTLLMASWGRPVDIEGLWDEASATIQTTDHAWVSFEGPHEGTHPLFEVVTYNGLIGPLEDAPYLLSPMPVSFDTEGGTIPRERVLDAEPWVLTTAWAEAEREGLVAANGGQDDYAIGAPGDYVFVDYQVHDGARVSFEAEIEGAWWSSLNGLGTDGLTDATVSGIGRTCIELPPGADPADITGLRIRSHAGSGATGARWFRYYDSGLLEPVELGSSPMVSFEDGGTATLFP